MTSDNHTLRVPKYVCNKHGPVPLAYKVDHRSFCPKCVADHMEKAIGVIRIEQ